MKTRTSSLRLILAGSVAALLAVSSANAANLYWDSNGTTPGLGDTAGTWGSSAFFHTISAPEGRGLIDGTLSPATTASAAADTVYFGTVNLALGSTASTIGIAAGGVTARVIVFGAGQGSQGVTLSGGGKITMDTTAGQFPLIAANNTGINTIGAELAGSLANALGIYGPGTVLLTGANTFTGGLVVRNGATLQVGNGTSGSLTSQNLTFNNGAGVFNVRALNAGSTQAMGTLTFNASGIGDGTVQSTYGGSGNAVLSFTSLAARGAGATGNFVVSGGSNGTTNKIVLTGATANAFIDKGLFFGGSEYAAYDSGGFVRAFNYASDTDASAVDTITASKHVKLTASPAAHAGDTLLSLNLSGGGVDYTMNAGSLTVPTILKSGGGGVSTISGGTSVTTGGTAELVIRTDTSSDLLTISSAVTGFSGGLTKTGAGTLTLSGSNDYTGGTRINAGTLVLSGGSALVDNQGVAFANVAGATLQLNSSETINDVSGGGFSGGNVNVGANTLTLARATGDYTFGGTFSGTSLGGIIKQGAGTLTLQNKNAFAGTITLAGGTLSLTYGNEATTSAQALSSGGAINMATGTTLNFTPGSNLLVGTLSGQLNFQASSPTNTWTIGNDIKVTSGTANITFGASNGSRFTFTGGVSGSSTPATNTILAVNTTTASFDNSSVSFSGVIQDGSGGSLGLNLTTTTAVTGAFISLANSNTFTGAISLNTTGAANGFVVIGGLRNSSGLTPGSGSLGSGGVYNNTISLTNSAVGVSVLNYASSANQTLGGAISGTNGRLQKEGTGTLTLSVANSYTGTTTINVGKLLLSSTGSLHASSAVTVAGGALGGTGTVNGTVALTTAGGIDLRDNAIGNLTLASTLGSTGALGANNLSFDLGDGTGTSDKILVTGTTSVTTSGAAVVTLNQLNGVAGRTATTYTLIGGAGTLDATNFGKFSLATTAAFGQTYALVHDLVSDGGTGNLQVSATNVSSLEDAAFWAGGGDNWSTTTNWRDTVAGNGAVAGAPDYQTNVTFNTTTPVAANLTTNVLDVDFDINSLTFSNTSAVTIGGAKTLTIEAAAVNGNTLGNGINSTQTTVTNTISSKIGLVASQTWTVAGTTVALGGLTVSGVISDLTGGGSTLTKAGTGTLTLSGANTYTGNTIVSEGTVKIGNASAFGPRTSPAPVTRVTVASGATVDFNGISDATYGYTISGTGVGGLGALVNNSVTALGTNFAQATNIRLADHATIGGTNTWALLTSGYAATSLDLNAKTLTKVGANTISLVNTTTTAGNIQVDAGTLAFGASDVGATGVTGAASAITLANTSGVNLNVVRNSSIGSLAGGGATGGNVAISSGITFTVGALNTDTSFGGVISGSSGALTKTGTGTLTLTNTNTYSGVTTVSAGVLRFNIANALPGDIGVAGGTSALTLNGGVVGLGNGDFTRGLGTGVTQVQFTGSGGFAAYTADRTVDLGGAAGTVTWGTGSFVPTSSSLILGAADADKTLTMVNPISLVAANRTVEVNNGSDDTDAVLSGNITATTSAGGLTKTGAGTLDLNGTTQGYNSLTATGGTTNVNGTLGFAPVGSAVVSVSGAGTKLRFGTVSQTLSSLTIGAGSTVIFTSGTASGSLADGGGKAAGFGTSASSFSGSATVPEPGTIGLLLVGALGVLNRRRRRA